MDDLHNYTENVLARQNHTIKPLPVVKPYEIYAYDAGDRKDPFESFMREEEQPIGPTAEGPQPDLDRNREELERFALDSLRMVGTLEQKSELWGLIQTTEGTIHRIQIGNYLGTNYGKIINILEDRIELTEIVPDGRGGWQERDAAISLTESGRG